MVLKIFLCAYFHPYILFVDVIVQVSWSFLNGVLIFLLFICENLYMLDASPLLDVGIANIFFWSVVLPIILILAYFTEQNVLILVECNLSFIFMDHAFGVM